MLHARTQKNPAISRIGYYSLRPPATLRDTQEHRQGAPNSVDGALLDVLPVALARGVADRASKPQETPTTREVASWRNDENGFGNALPGCLGCLDRKYQDLRQQYNTTNSPAPVALVV
jgi:hypothetical protein